MRLVATVVEGDRPSPPNPPPSSSDTPLPPVVTLQFQVIDTGVGIASDELDSIFQTFVQSQVGKAAMQGSGLGLSICKKLVALMGGDLDVSSEMGMGSTFRFTVPAQLTDNAHPYAEPFDQMVIAVTPAHHQRRILVVDDQRENRLLLVKLLQRVGLAVQEACDGHDAIQQWQAWQPDGILMDIRMPGLDGYDATRQIRAREGDTAHVIIMALTAQASKSDRALTLAAGCDDFITKPFQEATLFRKLAEHLGLEYIYTDLDAPANVPSSSPCPSVDSIPACLEPLDLSGILPDWWHALDDAAVCGDDIAIQALVSHLPPQLAPLATCLNTLAEHYQFEQIVQLLPTLTAS